MQRISTNVVVCALQDGGIGCKGKIPWRLAKDMKYFRELTVKYGRRPGEALNAVLMGRNTWSSIPKKFRPLNNRINVLLSRDREFRERNEGIDGLYCFESFQSLGEAIMNGTFPEYSRIFVIGGVGPYMSILLRSEPSFACDKIFLTHIFSNSSEKGLECDTYLPKDYLKGYRKLTQSEINDDGGGVEIEWFRPQHDEESGLDYEFQIWKSAEGA